MGEKTPDTDASGIERRNILKGLGFGAMGLAGAGAFAGNVTATQHGEFERTASTAQMVDYGLMVEPGGDHEISSIPRNNNGDATFTDAPDGGMDLVFQLDTPGTSKSGSHQLGYQVVLVRQDGNGPATKSVEEGRTRGFAGTVQTTPGGETQRREEFSTSGLQTGSGPTRYWAVLTVADYSGLPGNLAMDGGIIGFAVE